MARSDCNTHLHDASSSTRTARARAAVAALLAFAALVGCKSAPPAPPKPIDVQVNVVAAADLNPNRNGRASPVFLRVFQLRDASKFLNAEFDEATLHSDTVLAGVVIAREERMIEPATTVALPLKIDPETRLLGVVAEYYDVSNSQWRATSPTPEGGLLTLFKSQSLVIQLGRQAVTVAAQAPSKSK